MGAKENADLVRRGYEAFGAGDMATLSELLRGRCNMVCTRERIPLGNEARP